MRSATLTTTTVLFLLAACNTNTSSLASADSKDIDTVDLDAAKQAFGCDAPKDTPQQRACQGLAAFEKGDTVRAYPSDGESVFAARSDCVTQPHEMISFAIAKLSAGARSGNADGGKGDSGGIKTQFEAWVRRDGMAASAERITGELREGKPLSPLTPEEAEVGTLPKAWSEWRAKWEIFGGVEISTVQSDGKSLLERPSETNSGIAYWREAEGTLVRVAPPSGEWGWCVNHYYPVPE